MINIREIDNKTFVLNRNPKDKIHLLLRYAILAPSTHNTQPWLFKIGKDYCDIFFDKSKKLPHTDKKNRNLYISLGCLIENLAIASKRFNVYRKEEIILKDNHIARIYFDFSDKKIKVNNKFLYLLEAIPLRQNRRGIFESKKVQDSLYLYLKKIAKEYSHTSAQIITDKIQRNQIVHLTVRGMQLASKDLNFRKELATWINSNISSKKEGMPGYVFKLPLLPSLIFPFLLKIFNLGKINGKLIQKNMESASAICVITTKDDDKNAWLQAGRLAERLLLEIQAQKAHTTINVAAIEVEQLRGELQHVFDTKEHPHFLFTIGYMKGLQKSTPRVNVIDKIIS